jgi:hypothetical protein
MLQQSQSLCPSAACQFRPFRVSCRHKLLSWKSLLDIIESLDLCLPVCPICARRRRKFPAASDGKLPMYRLYVEVWNVKWGLHLNASGILQWSTSTSAIFRWLSQWETLHLPSQPIRVPDPECRILRDPDYYKRDEMMRRGSQRTLCPTSRHKGDTCRTCTSLEQKLRTGLRMTIPLR